MKKVLVFGSINIDLIYHVNDLPTVGETIISNGFATSNGGKGANQSYAIAKMGLPHKFIGKVGYDENGKNAIHNLNEVGVDTTFITTSEKTTGTAIILVDDKADNMIIVNSGANHDFDINELENYLDVIEESDIVLTQLENPIEFTFALLKKAKAAGKITILNPGPAIKLNEEQIKLCDYIVPNETELSIILGYEISDDIEIIKQRAIELQKKANNTVIVTVGSRGSIIVDQEGLRQIEAQVVEAVDPTAAGDTFIGTITMMLAKGGTIDSAIEMATFASALSVTRSGAQPSIPSYDEVIEFKENKK